MLFALQSEEGGIITASREVTEIKSRDFGSSVSSPSKRKSKKKTAEAYSTSLEARTQSTDASPAMSSKFVSGVAIVSIFIGIILGKRY